MVLFKRRNNELLYFLHSNTGTQDKVAFLPQQCKKSSIKFQESWGMRGIYLFLGEPVEDQVLFRENVDLYIGTHSTVRFLWIENPNSAVNKWRANRLSADQSGPTSWIVSQTSSINFRNYSLVIGGQCTLTPGTSPDKLTITASAPSTICFETHAGVYKLFTEKVDLSFEKDKEGCLQFFLLLSAASHDNPVSGIDKLDAGCRYFVNDIQFSDHNFLQSLRYPIFNIENGNVTLYACLDPVNPLSSKRTYFTFIKTSMHPKTELKSYFKTVFGESIMLTPIPAKHKLVFSPRPITIPQKGQEYDADPFTLTLDGAFEMRVPSSVASVEGTPVHRITCGISGVEYAGLMSKDKYTIHFFSGHNAYAPDFMHRGQAEIVKRGCLLDNEATTSWVYMTPSNSRKGSIIYYAQPQDSILYEPTDPIFNSYMEVPAHALPPTVKLSPHNGNLPTVFPMVPYVNIDLDFVEDFRQIELQVLSPFRRERIRGICLGKLAFKAASGDTPRYGATPMGLLAEFDGNLEEWKTLTLAQQHVDSTRQLLQLSNIKEPLKAALQTNQLFLVISNPETFYRNCSVQGNTFTVAGWDFILFPSSEDWKDRRTIVILKYSDKSIEELVQNPDAWTWSAAAEGFGDGTTKESVQKELIAIISDAIKKSETLPDFEYFVHNVVASPTWNGILFLRCSVPLTVFPPQIQGLAAGIDEKKFYAHHIGINISPVKREEAKDKVKDKVKYEFVQEDSSFFGLIDYDDPGHLNYKNKDYDFKVLSLKVLFKNSAVASFSSQVELMINKLFGEDSSLLGSKIGNNLILNGIYQKDDETESYLFIREELNLFKMMSHVLDKIETAKVQFVTREDQMSSQSNLVRAQFLLWGDMRFLTLPDLDIFSFGYVYNDKNEVIEQGQLNFSNLAVNMSFNLDTKEKNLTFDAGAVAFDVVRSVARTKSFFNHFPLKVAGLYQAPQGDTPGDQGFISLRTPLDQTDLKYPWYALKYDVNLGTLGNLVGGAGFIVTLAACWAPCTTGYNTYVGLKLPGSKSSRAEISIEGVLKLSFRGIELFVDGGETQGRNEYMLKFKNIALDLFGFTFPPGLIDLYMFGNPDGSDKGTLGWYTAYAKGGKK